MRDYIFSSGILVEIITRGNTIYKMFEGAIKLNIFCLLLKMDNLIFFKSSLPP